LIIEHLGRELLILEFASFGGRWIDCEVMPGVELNCYQVQGRMVSQSLKLCKDQNYSHLKMEVDNDLHVEVIVFQDDQLHEREIYQDRCVQS
jgi:hypothetical protein